MCRLIHWPRCVHGVQKLASSVFITLHLIFEMGFLTEPFYLDQQANRELQGSFYVLYQPSTKVTEARGHSWLLHESRVLRLVQQTLFPSVP